MQDYGTQGTFLKENQIIRAISYFDRSLHWYAPLNPYVQKSAQRLWEIGDRAERDGDLKLAFIAFSTIRSGFYGSREVRAGLGALYGLMKRANSCRIRR
jgi:hypothetical protein